MPGSESLGAHALSSLLDPHNPGADGGIVGWRGHSNLVLRPGFRLCDGAACGIRAQGVLSPPPKVVS